MEISAKKLKGISAAGIVVLGLFSNGSMNARQNLDVRDENGNKVNDGLYSWTKGLVPDNWHDVVSLVLDIKGDDNETPRASLPEVTSARQTMVGNAVLNLTEHA